MRMCKGPGQVGLHDQEQVNQIRQKANLFDCTIGNQSRNLFASRRLRIEKYLKVGQPVERPLSMAERDQSKVESRTKRLSLSLICAGASEPKKGHEGDTRRAFRKPPSDTSTKHRPIAEK